MSAGSIPSLELLHGLFGAFQNGWWLAILPAHPASGIFCIRLHKLKRLALYCAANRRHKSVFAAKAPTAIELWALFS